MNFPSALALSKIYPSNGTASTNRLLVVVVEKMKTRSTTITQERKHLAKEANFLLRNYAIKVVPVLPDT